MRSPAEMRDVEALGVVPAVDVVFDEHRVNAAFHLDDPTVLERHTYRRRQEALGRIPDVSWIHDEHAVTKTFGRNRVLKGARPVVPPAFLVGIAPLPDDRTIGLVEPDVGSVVG